MGFFTGRTGSVIVGGKKVAKVRDWSLDVQVNLLNTDTLGSYASTFVPGIKGATGSATLMYYRLNPGESNTLTEFTGIMNKILMVGKIEATDQITMELNVGDKADDAITFKCYINSASLSSSTGELAVVSVQFTVNDDFIKVPVS